MTDLDDVESQPLLDVAQPPVFAPYHAEHSHVAHDDVVSHDPHLNSDGEALYRFLLAEELSPPFYSLHCRGTHSETRTRLVTDRHRDGRAHTRTESYTEQVTDFDFCLQIHTPASTNPTHWSLPDSDPAYRGAMVREVEDPAGTGRRKATKAEINNYKASLKERLALGFPPTDTTMLSSKTVRQWADEYCASPKLLKEFIYEKVIYGWKLEPLEAAIRAVIAATPYSGTVYVDFNVHRSKVYIRPDNKLSRMLSNKWLKFISIILLVFPFIWLFKRFHSRGGGTWAVCGAAYAMKYPLDQHHPAEEPDDAVPPYQLEAPPLPVPSSSSGYSALPLTVSHDQKLVGLKEGKWLKTWEPVIRSAVSGRYKAPGRPLQLPGNEPDALLLDGYSD